MRTIYDQLKETKILPVVVLKDVGGAKPLAEALIRGGLAAAEITFRTAAAAGAIKAMREAYPDMLVGAGTVLTIEQAKQAIDAGAGFLVSPGLNPGVVRYCLEQNVCFIPGINNPSGIEAAMELGLSVVKFFPAQASGGIQMLRAMSAPYGQMQFLPTGGINQSNVKEYLDFPKVIACGGSWMVKEKLLDENRFDEIERLTRQARAAVDTRE